MPRRIRTARALSQPAPAHHWMAECLATLLVAAALVLLWTTAPKAAEDGAILTIAAPMESSLLQQVQAGDARVERLVRKLQAMPTLAPTWQPVLEDLAESRHLISRALQHGAQAPAALLIQGYAADVALLEQALTRAEQTQGLQY